MNAGCEAANRQPGELEGRGEQTLSAAGRCSASLQQQLDDQLGQQFISRDTRPWPCGCPLPQQDCGSPPTFEQVQHKALAPRVEEWVGVEQAPEA